MLDLRPRKLPRQGRSRNTVTAILDACACMLTRGGYEGLTTNHIAERAGVSIGTLYEYFPNKEAIAASLATRTVARLVEVMRDALSEALTMPALAGVEHTLWAGIRYVAGERAVFQVLAREAPFVFQLPAVVEAKAELDGLAGTVGCHARRHLNLPDPDVDSWLISRMLIGPMIDIAFAGDEIEQARMMRELARLTCRMTLGRDPAPDGVVKAIAPGLLRRRRSEATAAEL